MSVPLNVCLKLYQTACELSRILKNYKSVRSSWFWNICCHKLSQCSGAFFCV